MIILAIDPANTTGYALGDGQRAAYGTWDLTAWGTGHPGNRLVRLHELVGRTIRDNGVELIAFEAAMLVRVLDGRNRAKRPVWVSINVRSIREADELMGPAVVDRLRPGSIAAYCDWPSYRRPRMVWSGVSKPPRIAQRPMGE